MREKSARASGPGFTSINRVGDGHDGAFAGRFATRYGFSASDRGRPPTAPDEALDPRRFGG